MQNEESKSFLKSIKSHISSACDVFTRLYDRSLVCELARRLRNGILTLSQKAIGVFFLTFGIYSFLIGALITLFTSREVSPSNIYGGILMALCSVPLVFSKGNVSGFLTDSSFGAVVCDYFSIKKEKVKRSGTVGVLSLSFVLGVGFGAATVIFPLSSIVSAIAVICILCMIFTVPESGLTFMSVFLFFTGAKLHYLIIGAMLLSFAFKLIRKKRQIVLLKTDVLFLVFSLATLGAVLFTTHDMARDGSFAYLFLLAPYLIAVLFLREARKITKLLTVAVLSAGTFSALYIIGEVTASVAPVDTFVDRGYLARLVSSLPSFESGFAVLAITALIPVCTAFIVKPRSEGYRFTLILCLAAMITCLFMSENLACLMCAFIATVLLLLVTGSRWVYLSLGAVLFCTVVIFFAGETGDRIYNYVYQNIFEAYHQAESFQIFSDSTLSAEYILCGQGFAEGALGVNFYYSLISQLGIAGFMAFLGFLLLVILSAVKLIFKTYSSADNIDTNGRFLSSRNKAETRIGIIATVCSLISVLMAATFLDFYRSDLSYLMLFLLFGVCSAYTRSAAGEIAKAEGSHTAQCTSERATAVVVFKQHNQGGIK